MLISPAVFKLAKSKYRAVGYAVTPVFIIIQYVMRLAGMPIVYPWDYNMFFSWFLYFYAGILIGNGYVKIKIKKDLCAVLIGVFLVCQILENKLWLTISSYMAITQMKLSAAITSLLIILMAGKWISENDKPTENILRRFMVKLGDCSLAYTYLIC